MAQSILATGAEKLQQSLSEGGKVGQLASVTKDVNEKAARITTDYGVKQTNTGRSQASPLLSRMSFADPSLR
jgi:catalase